MSRLLVGPFNRVEGDLEISLQVESAQVVSAQVNAPMYRGFEQILQGKHTHDALVYVPRICGICSISQSVAAARALADMGGLAVPPNGRHASNLLLAIENLADHLTHFYLFFMPDFLRPVYASQPWFAQAQQRFHPQQGEQTRAAIGARQRWFTLAGTLGGKWPHTLSIDPGGSSRAIDAAERVRLLTKVREFRAFLEHHLFACALEQFADLSSEQALWDWHGRESARAARRGDVRLWLDIVLSSERQGDAALSRLGGGPGRYLSYGAFERPDGGFAFERGLWRAEGLGLTALDLGGILEDATHAWLSDATGPRHPLQGVTEPVADKPGAYTWNKAPRLAGEVVETGAIARQLCSGHGLIVDTVGRHGGTVFTRVLARLLELARVLPMMEDWLYALRPGEPYCAQGPAELEGTGVGLTEAARGSLGHWVVAAQGRIQSYQIVAPTSWNFSPRDAAGTPGALEQALVGAPVLPGESTPVSVQHIVRSFDPCMVCIVH
ncbi:nickel-dependent hydrogenase large subunit [Roseateles koreensis]|uniref:Nickel-dependent hydrogenase large subunit n=1 Tax=Roseateles koreensis TaxID=2987526 RepID=A0ABT5KUU6_9BURK|nr:nickel-dependent hydrogenase large subunit [Roseateles koreensis]MDC8786128.1 nickel-dependent hydrogenase large subunit [Roseateles koreensis]